MPRTKVPKSSKRSREEAVKEEKIREFEKTLESYINDLDVKAISFISDTETQLKSLVERTNDVVLNALFKNILDSNLNKMSDYENMICSTSTHRSELQTTRVMSGNDDGYITEDSGNSGSNSALTAYLSMTQRGRTPGPLSSAQARRNRRSRSACSDKLTRSISTTNKSHSQFVAASEHSSRNRIRTPMSARPKALSADRKVVRNGENEQKSPACAFLRWPKPGEFVLSVHGSPLVAQVMPDRFANVNIPFKDGVISLRPKKLADLDSGIVEKMDPETLQQIKTLQQNLHMIVSIADKANIE